MKESDLFYELIAIIDERQRAARLAQIGSVNPQLAESLSQLLAHYQPEEKFLSRSALEQVAELSDADVLFDGLKHFQEPRLNPPQEPAHDFLDRTKTTDTIGWFGGYEILRLISSGGSAKVYQGIDPQIDKTVAIKVLHTDQANNRVAINRLQKEARAMGRIKHENVVEVYRISMEPVPFIAMEFVEGESLDQLIDRRGMLELNEFLIIARQILKGIQAAHDLGWVHRDLKPANILLTHSAPTIVKITDFGLVRREKDSRLTRSGSVVGTPRYMSPEQIRDESTDARSDLFSLGSVFYEMLSGAPLFKAEGQYAEMRSVLHDQPNSLHDFRTDIPVALEQLIRRMLEKEPKRRFQSASAILSSIETIDWQCPQPRWLFASKRLKFRCYSMYWIAGICVCAVLLMFLVLSTSPSKLKVESVKPDAPERLAQGQMPSESDSKQKVVTVDHPWTRELRLPFPSKVAAEYQQKWADALGVAVESENQFGIRFVLIPPGEFQMGFSPEEFAELNEVHDNPAELEMMRASCRPTWVRITFPFYISKYEITEAERARVLGTDHSLPSILDLEYTNVRPRGNSEDHPVTRVPWEEAQRMCQRLNEKCGLAPWDVPVSQEHLAQGVYRLPTEAEWEWASRAGRIGVTIADPEDLKKEVWMLGNSRTGVQIRGLKKPNAFGLHDTLGNVQEWCLDNFDAEYFAGNSASNPLINPIAITEHPHFRKGHILRGGAVIFGDTITNFTFKTQRDQYSSSWFTGFRITRPIPQEVVAKIIQTQ